MSEQNIPQTPAGEDVEGHIRARFAQDSADSVETGEDVKGHIRARFADGDEDGDDVEGHIRAK